MQEGLLTIIKFWFWIFVTFPLSCSTPKREKRDDLKSVPKRLKSISKHIPVGAARSTYKYKVLGFKSLSQVPVLLQHAATAAAAFKSNLENN